MENPEFTFHLITPTDYEKSLTLFWNHFMPYEPTTQLAGCCTRPGYRIYNLDTMLRKMLCSQTCYMAKNKDGNIVGVVFCHIIDKNNPFVYHSRKEYLQQGWPCDFIPVLLLLDQLCHHQNILKSKNVDRFIDIFAVVVNTNYRHRGLASQLITKTLDEAQASNMPLATISCTSFFTQRCSLKLGFTAEKTIAYKDWNWGKKTFSVHPVHSNAVLFTKYLSTKD